MFDHPYCSVLALGFFVRSTILLLYKYYVCYSFTYLFLVLLSSLFVFFFFFNDTATPEIYTTDTLFPHTTLFRSPDGDPVPTTDAAKPMWGQPLPWRPDGRVGPPTSHRLKMRLTKALASRFMRTPSPTRRVDDAEVITLAGREWVSLHTPGQTADHLCLYDPTEDRKSTRMNSRHKCAPRKPAS